MPEEFRAWKEKVDALQARKSSQPPSRESNTHSHNHPHHNNSNIPNGASNSSSNYSTQSVTSAEPPVVYASYAEASEAFKELMTEKKVSATAKMREVQDLCQADVRWDALKTMGEKKQALAEYQVRSSAHTDDYVILHTHFLLMAYFALLLIDKEIKARKGGTEEQS